MSLHIRGRVVLERKKRIRTRTEPANVILLRGLPLGFEICLIRRIAGRSHKALIVHNDPASSDREVCCKRI
jgi:hypothetical protein